ncbi:uncharacterized protein LOC132197888 isoform X2 [Neocloeon triangulifer]|uniref:uncharacterized protein LOC132197888 isoform X2 n=1 Tax=Neocloeon triangulifer TaxID=2078957 RepID=UPI00286F1939|nr:uncharacterized protein LOC132197888 isoform X2 [Neocloeon triangulifer]
MAGWQRIVDSLSNGGVRSSDPAMAEVVSVALGVSWAARSWDAATSRNYIHAARFQHRQLLEKEQKLLQMLEDQQQRTIQRVSGRGSAGSNTSSGSGSSTNSTEKINKKNAGKVRQLFEERRSMHSLSSSMSSMSSTRSHLSESKSMPIGWDRSYPLDPLKPKTGPARAPLKAPAQRTSSQQAPVSMRPAVKTNNRGPLQDSSNGGTAFGRLSNVGARNGLAPDTENSQQQVVSKKPVVKALGEPKIKVAPAKRVEAPRPRPQPTAAASPVTSPTKSVSPPYSADLKASKTKSPPSSSGAAAPVKHSEPCPPGMAECNLCGRRFADDRIGKHEEICRKTKQKKRKTFDPVKMRTQGTEAETFVKSAGKSRGPAVAAKKQQPKSEASKGNWRKKHEDFIETIRQARMVKQIMDAGGKLSDLPPPKPMDTSDYVQCPHCSRRFSEGAAERHIPRCANIKSNKPAPRARK